jgi:potassium inwardly-rectifying channel subfamily J
VCVDWAPVYMCVFAGKRDGDLYLLLRVGDMRKSQLVEAHIRAILIKKRVTVEGEVLPLAQQEVIIGEEEGQVITKV